MKIRKAVLRVKEILQPRAGSRPVALPNVHDGLPRGKPLYPVPIDIIPVYAEPEARLIVQNELAVPQFGAMGEQVFP